MICDIRMSPIDGMQLLRQARREQPSMDVIMLTAYGSVETAVEAMKEGAFDYVTKPFKVDELLMTVKRALERGNLIAENTTLKARLDARYRFENIVAESPAMRTVCEMIERVAPTDTTVLIHGESGTGKELVAKAIHAHSLRKTKPFVPINCAALPEPLLESEMFGHVKGAFTGATNNKEGLFETASGGTIFLDEIGSMPLNLQGKLLRVLQEREIRTVGGTKTVPVDCRVLAATNDRLEEQIQQGEFREDLYYRLSVIPIEIRPLRERREDILPLVYHVMRGALGSKPDEDSPRSTPKRRSSWNGTTGPATCGSWKTPSAMPSPSPRKASSTAATCPARIVNAFEDVDLSAAGPGRRGRGRIPGQVAEGLPAPEGEGVPQAGPRTHGRRQGKGGQDPEDQPGHALPQAA